jgi:hypothetical protein
MAHGIAVTHVRIGLSKNERGSLIDVPGYLAIKIEPTTKDNPASYLIHES